MRVWDLKLKHAVETLFAFELQEKSNV